MEGMVLLKCLWPWSHGTCMLEAASADPVAGLMGDWFSMPPSTQDPS